jgi:hypothetical protein
MQPDGGGRLSQFVAASRDSCAPVGASFVARHSGLIGAVDTKHVIRQCARVNPKMRMGVLAITIAVMSSRTVAEVRRDRGTNISQRSAGFVPTCDRGCRCCYTGSRRAPRSGRHPTLGQASRSRHGRRDMGPRRCTRHCARPELTHARSPICTVVPEFVVRGIRFSGHRLPRPSSPLKSLRTRAITLLPDGTFELVFDDYEAEVGDSMTFDAIEDAKRAARDVTGAAEINWVSPPPGP